jgi:hypothetical protein
MANFLIFGAIVAGIDLIMLSAVIAFRKSDKTRIKGIARLGKALSDTKEDPIEPVRFVP